MTDTPPDVAGIDAEMLVKRLRNTAAVQRTTNASPLLNSAFYAIAQLMEEAADALVTTRAALQRVEQEKQVLGDAADSLLRQNVALESRLAQVEAALKEIASKRCGDVWLDERTHDQIAQAALRERPPA